MILALGDKSVQLELLNISDLKPHEETIRRFSEELEANVAQDALQRDPIIVDEKSGVVLDGMHRLEVLKKLGAQRAVCYLVDYASKDVGLFRWLRAVKKPAPKLLFRLERELDLRWVSSGSRESPTRLEIWHREDRLESTRDLEFPQICATVRRFDRIISQERARIEFLDEETFRDGRGGTDVAVLVTPRIRKSHVIFAARTGALLPPKSTLHVFPIRPMGVNYPIGDLKSGRDELETILAPRRRRRIEPPAIRDGRRYREELLVFD
jgi:hypothetical protein